MKKSISILVLALTMSSLTSQNISTIAGTGVNGITGDGGSALSGQISDPRGVATDANGNIYFVDNTNNIIRKVDASGIISTFAGQAVAGFSGDGGAASSAQFNAPSDVVVDNSGTYLYVADAGNNRIRRIHISTGTITTIAGTGVSGSAGDGGAANIAPLASPTGLGMDASGNLYVAVTAAHAIRMINTSGVISKFAGTYGMSGVTGDNGSALSARLGSPSDVVVTGSTVYIADNGNNRIRRVVGGTITTYAGSGGSLGDNGPAASAQLFSPVQISVDANGNLYIADFGQNRVRVVNTLGTISTLVGNGIAAYSGDGGICTSAQINAPAGVHIDQNGNLIISDNDNFRLRKVCLATPILTVAGTNTICQGASTTLSVTGASTYSWISGPTTSINVVNPSNTTAYTVTGITAGCSAIATRTVTVKATPTLQISGNLSICHGASTTLSVTGASTYSWSTNSVAASISVAPTTNTVYSVTGTSLGCSSTQSVSVIVNALPVLSFPSFGFADTLCTTAGVQNLTGASPSGGVYSGIGVTAGAFSPTIAGIGTFSVTYSYTNTAGCSSNINRAVVVVTCAVTNTLDVGIAEYSLVTVGIYPNPANDQITIDGQDVTSVVIFDLIGAQVLIADTNKVDVSTLPTGIYYLQAHTAKGVSKSARLIKQ